jgi:hypothetical protein
LAIADIRAGFVQKAHAIPYLQLVELHVCLPKMNVPGRQCNDANAATGQRHDKSNRQGSAIHRGFQTRSTR